jgi:regulator of sigma E protease
MGNFLSHLSVGTGALAILALGILIIVHEGGHFLVARLSGMRVDRFSIGFGPKLLSFKRGETIYQIAAIPLGGFVQIAGLNPGEEGISVDDPRAYPNRPVYQRLATIFAGPGTNYVFAAILMCIIHLVYGVPVEGKTPLVNMVTDGTPAAAAGVQPADEILSVDGKKVSDTTDVAPLIDASGGRPIAFEVLRDGQRKVLTVTPRKDGSSYRIGIQITPKEETAPAPASECIKKGLMFPISYSRWILHGFGEIIAGRQKAEFSGPVGIVRVMQSQIAHGGKSALSIIAIISVYLGLFNLLPLPALDGGRLVFLGWELISRRRVNQRIEQTVHMVGMFVLLGFILYITIGKDLGLIKALQK